MAGKKHGDFEWMPGISALTNEELDGKLDQEVARNGDSEMHICFYLNEVRDRRASRVTSTSHSPCASGASPARMGR